MPSLAEDAWVNQQAVTHELSEIEDCAIAVDATYYIQHFLDSSPSHEPLLPALGGLTGFQSHIESDIDQWLANKVTPLFVFDGQTMIGQDEVSLVRGLRANERTNQAWELYRTGQAESAVSAFGANSGAFRPQSLYHLLQSILKSRNLHFLVAPCSAAAQVAYFDLIDSDQCGGIMGSQELLLYPIGDSVIRSIDWAAKTVTAISKKQIIKSLGVSEPMFIDALLMTGTSFLPVFPALQDGTVNPRQPTVMDAINMLRASDKSVATACASFNDILQAQDPNWLDKYRKARMAVNHFIHITEKGEVKVNELDRLTNDNHEYLGLQLPPELFHYLNTGLISPRVMSWITHCKILVLPTLDGVATPEYKQLISSQLVPVKEMTLGLLIPRLNRGIQHRDVTMRVWYDEKFTHSVNHRNLQPSPGQRAASWNVSDASIKAHVPSSASGSIAAEVAALKKPEFVKSTLAKGSKSTLDSADSIVSLSIWRLLHLRDYVNDEHELTAWGQALSKALTAIEPTVKKYPEVAGLNEAILVAFELLRFDLLNARNKHEELYGMPMNGSEEDIASLLLLSRCASLLKLRHQANGYTGPLSKNYLTYRSLVSAVREADRDLTESIVASMFMYGQTKRERDDNWQINDRLPFLRDPDVALSIAVKTLLDELPVDEAAEERAARIEAFPAKFVPFATHFVEDLTICYALFDAILAGVRSLDDKLVSAADKKVWEQTSKYLQARR